MVIRSLIALSIALGVVLTWSLTPLGEYANAKSLAALAGYLRESPYSSAIVLGVFIISGLLFVPLTALVTATALTFDPGKAFALATGGCVISALAGFAVGHALGAAPLRRLAGPTVNRLSRGARRHGILLVMTLRLVPIAHFSMINLASGASHVRLRDFFTGTVLGCIPGIAAITVIGSQARSFLAEPNPLSFLWLAGVALLGLSLLHLLRRRMRKYSG